MVTTAVDAVFNRVPILGECAKTSMNRLLEARAACQRLRAGAGAELSIDRFANTLCDLYGASVVATMHTRNGLSTDIATPAGALDPEWPARLSRLLRPTTDSRATVLTEAALSELSNHDAIMAAVLIPIEGRRISLDGTLFIGWREQRHVTEFDRLCFSMLGQEVTAALETAILDERLSLSTASRERLLNDSREQRYRLDIAMLELERARQLETARAEHLKEVERLGSLLSSELELPVLLRKVAESLLAVTGATYSALLLAGSDARTSSLGGAASHATEDLSAILESLHRPEIALPIIFQGQTILVNDMRLHPKLRLLLPEHRSLLGVPLRFGERKIGALIVGHREPGRFDTHELELAKTISTQAVMAIENARLVGKCEQHPIEARAFIEQVSEEVSISEEMRPALLHGRVARSGFDGAVRKQGAAAADMTEIKRLEDAKDEFLSLVAHELRTPLTPMTMLLQSLEHKARSGIVDLDAIVRTRRQVVRLTKLISDLLDFSRVTAQDLELDLCPLDLAQLASEIVDTFRTTSPKHTIDLSLVNAPLYVSGDKSRLEQVIVNLLDNAVKYSPTGGPIRLEAERTSSHVTLSVTDEGIGIPADQVFRLFERFFRAENASNRKFQGFGLGLHLADSIIRKHRGWMNVRSAVGQGSRFSFTLPLAETETVRHRPKTAPRLLLVDDDPDILHVVGDILEEEGYEVLRAHNGAEALRHVETALPDLLLIDLMMPVTDGWEVLGKLRNRERWCQIPIIVLSAHNALAEQATALHADAYLGKPFEVDALIRKVAELLPAAARDSSLLRRSYQPAS